MRGRERGGGTDGREGIERKRGEIEVRKGRAEREREKWRQGERGERWERGGGSRVRGGR